MKPKQDIRRFRRLLNLNQTEFWSQFGVTQSGGCRYEGGRNIPRPVLLLMQQTYPALFGLDSEPTRQAVPAPDPVTDYLQKQYPKLYSLLERELEGAA